MFTTRSWARYVAGAALTSSMLALVLPAQAANELAIKTLVDQAKFWQSKGRGDLAADAWKKLLSLDAGNVEALSFLAQFESDNNRPESSRTYTDRLKQVQGGASAARRIEAGTASRSVDNKQLEEARAAAKAGKAEEAARRYRQLFVSKPPSGPLGLEYYQTLGGTEGGWDEARQGLARLTAEDPNDRSVALAYAQHLTYRASTRREGIRLLTALARQPDQARPATDAWRKALIWLDAVKNDIPLFQAYLSVQSSDAAIRNRLDALNRLGRVEPAKVDPAVLTLRDGFTALNSGDLEQASERFEKLLAENANNTDALGGLGVIRLKQERFAEAEKLLAQATRGGQNLAKWATALNSARFWQELDRANASRRAGQNEVAATQFSRAQTLDPSQTLPMLGLADILAEQGKFAQAERSYQLVLAKEPASIDALRGLAGVLAQQGRVDEALLLAEKLSPEQREKLGGYGALKAEQMRLGAMAASARGDNLTATQLLEDALLWDPTSPWLRLELGRLYQAAGAVSDAKAVVDGLLMSNPEMPGALYASALMRAESEDWLGGLDQLERIPAGSRTKEMLALQRRLWVRAQAARASALAASAQMPAARQILQRVEPVAAGDGELMGAVAQVYSDVGEDARALAIMRAMIAQNTRPDVGMMLQYTAILLKTRQDGELAAQMRSLYTLPLDDKRRADLDRIRIAYSLRQFDLQREANQISAAYEILMPMIAERPDDSTLQLALARLYASGKEYKDALAWYDHVLQRDPDNLDTLVAAAGAALAASDLSYSESAINRALQLVPENPPALTVLGKIYRAQGKIRLAEQTFQRALAGEQRMASQAVSGPLGMRLINYTLPSADARPRSAGAATLDGTATTPGIPRITPPLQNNRAPAAPARRNPAMQPMSEQSAPPKPADAFVASNVLPSGGSPSEPRGSSMLAVQYRPGSALPQREPILNDYLPVPSAAPSMGQRAAPDIRPLPPLQPVQRLPTDQTSPFAPAGRPSLLQIPAYNDSRPAGALAPSEPATRPLAVGSTREAQALREEIDELRAQRSGSGALGGSWRSRSGDAGTSALSDLTIPMETRLPMGDGGHVVLRVIPVALDSGQISRTDLNTSQRFGTNAFSAAGALTTTNANQQASGVGFGVGYESLRLKFDLGNTPAGFRAMTAVGGVSYNDRVGDLSVKVDLSRRSVTDSVLSYAGTVDDRTGTVWGGVTATGGRAEIGMAVGDYGAYGFGSYHFVGGKNVANNNRYEGGAGVYYKLINSPGMELTAGLSATALGYDKNLRYFTLGHGGYFSPQRYFSLNIPVEWTGRNGLLSYRLDGSIGLQSFRESSAAYFPTSAGLQTAWEAAATEANATAGGPTGVTWKTSYPGQSKTGLGFRMGGAAEYRLAPKWVVGGKLAIDNASDYFQTSGLIYLRYNFEGSNKDVSFPPNTLRVNQ